MKRIWERAKEATVKSGGEPLSELIHSGAGGSHRENFGPVGVVPSRLLCWASLYHQRRGWNLFPLPLFLYTVPSFLVVLCWLPFGDADKRLARLLVATLSGGRDEGALEPLENQIEAAFR